jgi:hypothetical protein
MMSPAITNLTVTTIYSLVVTDITTGCVGEPSLVTVSVTGSPLACNPVASPAILCKGTPSTLHAMVGGGSGSYTYSWTSIPPGFTSQEAEPDVVPDETTSYSLTVSDGFNTASGTTNVQVRPVPLFNNWPSDTTACVYETVFLDAGNPNSVWYWSNGATTRSIPVQSTGIGSDYQYYKVKVMNEYGCIDSAESRVSFSFSACTGISEVFPGGRLLVFPNPGNGKIHLEMCCPGQFIELSVHTVVGQRVLTEKTGCYGKEPHSLELDLSDHPKGLYLITLKSPDFSRTVKFVLH